MTAKRLVKSVARARLLSLLVVAGAVFVISGCGQPAATEGSAGSSSGATDMQQFAVEGMTCEGCVSTVTSAIQKVAGVESVNVSLDDKKATVTGDATQATPAKIEAAVQEAGYEAKLISPDEAPEAATPEATETPAAN